jgi:tRNA G18 (ribose-2'-O)-methylase SpoU
VPIRTVSSLDDPALEPYRRVTDRRWHERQGSFIAEGRWVVERLIAAPELRVRSLLVNAAALRGLSASLESLEPCVPVYCASGAQLEALTGHDFHRGCLAVGERPAKRVLDDLLPRARRWLVLDSIANPDNVGGLFRTALGLGVDALLLSPTTGDPFFRKTVRTSMAAVFELPYVRAPAEQWPRALAQLTRHGSEILALTPRPDAVDLERVASDAAPSTFALVVGAEGSGLSDEVETFADRRVRIPTRAAVDSLNVTVAAAIALSRLIRLSCPPAAGNPDAK